MAKTVEISLDSFKRMWENVKSFFLELKEEFLALDMFEQYAWGAVGLGFVLVIVGIIVW